MPKNSRRSVRNSGIDSGSSSRAASSARSASAARATTIANYRSLSYAQGLQKKDLTELGWYELGLNEATTVKEITDKIEDMDWARKKAIKTNLQHLKAGDMGSRFENLTFKDLIPHGGSNQIGPMANGNHENAEQLKRLIQHQIDLGIEALSIFAGGRKRSRKSPTRRFRKRSRSTRRSR
jgi:hypothetical protein